MSERTGPVAAVVIGAALVAAAGGWWWSQRETGPRLGDYGRVTAEVGTSCSDLTVEVDGLRLWGTIGPLPAGWTRGGVVEGNLELTEREEGDGQEGVAGTFTADDGVQIEVSGGRSGEYFFELACAIWPDEPTG